MAMGSAGGGGGRRGNRRTKRKAALSEINVTPMVDVMLVLLIIFMISAPLLTSGVKVDLPKTEAAALKDEGDPLTVSIKADGAIFIMDEPATYEQLIPRLLAMTGNDTDKPIYVRADAKTPYENVAQVTAKLSTSGFVHLNLLSDPMSKGAKVSVPASSPAASSGAAAQ